MRLRVLLGAVGVAGVLYGALGLLTHPRAEPLALGLWLAAAVAVHDGLLVPLTLLAGAALARVVPPRARGHVQGVLVAGALVAAVTLPLVLRRGTVPAAKALLEQDYATNLALVVAVIAAGGAAAYAVRVRRDRRALRGPGGGDRLTR